MKSEEKKIENTRVELDEIADILEIADGFRRISPQESRNLQILREFTGFPFEGIFDKQDYYVHAYLLFDLEFGKSIKDGIFGECDLYLMSKFNIEMCKEIKGNAVILTDKNIAYFIVEDKIVMKDEKPQTVAGINRQEIALSHSIKPIKYTVLDQKKESIIEEATSKVGHSLFASGSDSCRSLLTLLDNTFRLIVVNDKCHVLVIPEINTLGPLLRKNWPLLIDAQRISNSQRFDHFLLEINALQEQLNKHEALLQKQATDLDVTGFLSSLSALLRTFKILTEKWLRICLVPHLSIEQRDLIKISINKLPGSINLPLIKSFELTLQGKLDNTLQEKFRKKHLELFDIFNEFYSPNKNIQKQLQLGVKLDHLFLTSLLELYFHSHMNTGDDFDINYAEKLCLEIVTEDFAGKMLTVHYFATMLNSINRAWLPALQSFDCLMEEAKKIIKAPKPKKQKNKSIQSDCKKRAFGRIIGVSPFIRNALYYVLDYGLKSPKEVIARINTIKSEMYTISMVCNSSTIFKENLSPQINVPYSEGIINYFDCLLSIAQEKLNTPKKQTIPQERKPFPRDFKNIEYSLYTPTPIPQSQSPSLGTCFTPPMPTIRLSEEELRAHKKKKKKKKPKSDLSKAVEAKTLPGTIYYLDHPFYKGHPDAQQYAIPAILAPFKALPIQIVRDALKILEKGVIGLQNNQVKPVTAKERTRYGLAKNVSLKIKGKISAGEFKGQMFRIDGGWETNNGDSFVFFRTLRKKVHCGPQKSTTTELSKSLFKIAP